MALHFLSVFFVLRSPPCHGAALFRPITLCFLSYSYFRHFGLNHYGPKPSWSVVPCGTRSASAEEMRMHSSEAAKVLGFPKSCARTKNLCKAPSLAGTFRTECVGVGSRATHVKRLVHMRNQLRHNAIDLCQPRGGLCTSNRARARFGKPKTPKLCDRFAQMSLVYGCSLHLFHTHESVEIRNFRERPCEKTNFRSWRKWDELSILNLIETFLQFF